jgi:hypothetical protein
MMMTAHTRLLAKYVPGTKTANGVVAAILHHGILYVRTAVQFLDTCANVSANSAHNQKGITAYPTPIFTKFNKFFRLLGYYAALSD